MGYTKTGIVPAAPPFSGLPRSLSLLPPLGSVPLQPYSGALAIKPLLEPIELPHLVIVERVHRDIGGHLVLAPAPVSLGSNVEVDLTPVVVHRLS